MDFFCDFNEDDELVFDAVAQPSKDMFIATLPEFQDWVTKMNKEAEDAMYVFKKMEGSFWVLEENLHHAEDIACGVLEVVEDGVYALSHDVMSFVKNVLNKFDI